MLTVMPSAIAEMPFTFSYLSRLNPPQKEAVEATEGPVLVLAGAGTGKTRVLTTRIAHLLITRKAFAGNILAVTFTNKAAREMVGRVQTVLSEASGGERLPEETTRGMWLGTFHSIAARILRRHAEAVGLTSTFSILDDDDQMRLIKAILAEKNIDEKQLSAKIAHAIIQQWKDRGLTPDKVTASYMVRPQDNTILELYKAYQQRLRAVNACDFGDLLLHNLTLFASQPPILQEYSQRFRYILVDEYQDTNVAQYLWLRLLAVAHQNLCCVGDDDQSIYAWRGAEVGNILKFEQDFPGAKIVRLEQNYRSTRHILGAASALISKNQGRLGKTLWTDQEGGERIRIKAVWDDQEEARFVGEEIEAQQRDKVSLSEIAILVRAGFQTRPFEERFLTLGLPYRVIGGLRFYERMEIRDAIAYLRLVVEPRDDLAFERIINTPKRGVGKATLEQIHAHARARNISLVEASSELLQGGAIKGKAGGAMQLFLRQRETWASEASLLGASKLAEKLLEESGYVAMWREDKSPEAQGRIENLGELVRALGEFETLGEFLEHVSLVMDREENQTSEMISIMTLHAAKGLEFDTVFLGGWEEGLFPHQRSLDEEGTKGLEEERRLAYVGITRAKRLSVITHAASRRIYAQWQSSIPSRFLGELPDEHIDVLEGGAARSRAAGPQMFQREIERIMGNAVRVDTNAKFQLGQRVFHLKFGYGKIRAVNGEHIEVAFEKAGEKKVMADYLQKA